MMRDDPFADEGVAAGAAPAPPSVGRANHMKISCAAHGTAEAACAGSVPAGALYNMKRAPWVSRSIPLGNMAGGEADEPDDPDPDDDDAEPLWLGCSCSE